MLVLLIRYDIETCPCAHERVAQACFDKPQAPSHQWDAHDESRRRDDANASFGHHPATGGGQLSGAPRTVKASKDMAFMGIVSNGARRSSSLDESTQTVGIVELRDDVAATSSDSRHLREGFGYVGDMCEHFERAGDVESFDPRMASWLRTPRAPVVRAPVPSAAFQAKDPRPGPYGRMTQSARVLDQCRIRLPTRPSECQSTGRSPLPGDRGVRGSRLGR